MTLRSLCPVAFLVSIFLSGCERSNPPDTAETDPRVEKQSVILPDKSRARESVVTAAAQPAAPRRAHLNGRIVWNDDVTVRVYAPFAGRVERVIVQPSTRVAKGDALAVIASSEFAQIRSDAKKAEADFALADKTRERLRFLVAHGAAAQKDVQAAEADYDRAKSELERSRATMEMRGGTADSDPGQFILRAPLGGVVVEKNVSPGQEVRADQMLANAPQFFAPLFIISDPTDLWVLIDAPDQDMASLAVGATVVVRSSSLREMPFKAKVEAVSDALDPATRMLRVRARVENPEHLLKAEMFVSVELETPAVQGVDTPANAVLMNNDRHFVFVEDNPGHYSRREVQLGGQQGDKLWIRSGIAPGERVVVEGTQFLERIHAASSAD